MKRHQQTRLLSDFYLITVLIIFVLVGSPVFATESTNPANEDEQTSIAELFEYQLENRSDPFLPFIKEKKAVAQVNMDEIISPDESLLTGMQLFEPDQLKVVGFLATSKSRMAMVQDLIGQGYTIEIGTLIGKRGVVKDITPKGVIIEETAVTRAGKKKITKIVMALKPEGEE